MNICFLKNYSTIFGNIGQGAHKYRIADAAAIDYFLTIFLAYIIAKITQMPIVLTTILSFVLAIILHIIFGVQTTTLSYLGISC